MCVAVYCNKEKKLDDTRFRNFSLYNKDGFGLMYVHENKLHTYRTIDVNEFKNRYDSIYKDFGKTSPMVLHFRLATSGKKDVKNCHPFIIGNGVGFVHNGIFTGYGNDEISDTHAFAKDILEPLSKDLFKNDMTEILLREYIGTSNKLIFLNSHMQHIIINEDCGTWIDGMWISTKYTVSNSYHGTHNNVNTSYKYCEVCKVLKLENKCYSIKSPFSYERLICSDCITEDTKISDLVYVAPKKVIKV